MSDVYVTGQINGHIVGIVVKELVRRAINAIRNRQQVFEVTSKVGYSGEMDDLFTSADTAAQDVYIRSIQECFPHFGVIAEEQGIRINPSGSSAYFTIDPLDGTKAFKRRQSHGIGSMIALVVGDEVVCAYVGDVNTQEIYGFRPGSEKVHRISMFNACETLGHTKLDPKEKKYVLLRDPLERYSADTRLLVDTSFASCYQIDAGSIGTWAARLWKREVVAAIVPPGNETPWDSTPVIGISQKLGYCFYRPKAHDPGWERFTPELPTGIVRRKHDMLIVHAKDANKILYNEDETPVARPASTTTA